jgi:hypothetical protein
MSYSQGRFDSDDGGGPGPGCGKANGDRSVLDYVEGRLSPENRAVFEQHLVHCEHCMREVEVERTIGSVLSDRSVPPDLDESVLLAVYSRIQGRRRAGRTLRTVLTVAYGLASLSGLWILGIWAGWLDFGSGVLGSLAVLFERAAGSLVSISDTNGIGFILTGLLLTGFALMFGLVHSERS